MVDIFEKAFTSNSSTVLMMNSGDQPGEPQWEPNPDELQQVLQLLKQSQSPDTNTQRAVQEVGVKIFFW